VKRPSPAGVDVLVVSLGTTGGWRAAAAELVASLERVGARVALVQPGPARRMRTFALTDLSQALATRAAARRGMGAYRPAAIVYCSVTASLLWPARGAIWLDAVAAENRPGRHGVWQRPVERRRLGEALVVMTMAARALDPLGPDFRESVLVPVPVEPSAAGPPHSPAERDLAAVTYAGDPAKKRLEAVLAAWDQTRRDGETLVVAGTDAIPSRPGVEVVGRLPPSEYRALLRRARVFVAAPRREDYGIAPLEALADGCMLVSIPAPGPYPALTLARALDSRLVSDDLRGAIRTALDEPGERYAARALELLAPFRRDAVDRALADEVLPRLLPGRRRRD
jgi:hypothetical protein